MAAMGAREGGSSGELRSTRNPKPGGLFSIGRMHMVSLRKKNLGAHLGVIATAGRRHNGFFDRDAFLSGDRRLAFVTNPPDRTMSVIDISARAVIRELPLPATPRWMKVLT